MRLYLSPRWIYWHAALAIGAVTTLNLFSMLILLLKLRRCVYYLLWPWIYLARCSCHRGFAAAFIICHDVEFIKYAALAMGNLRMRLLSVTTLNSFSMLLLPSGLCRCVYFCHDVEFISHATLAIGALQIRFLFATTLNSFSMIRFVLGLNWPGTLLLSWNFTIKVFAFTVLNCRCLNRHTNYQWTVLEITLVIQYGLPQQMLQKLYKKEPHNIYCSPAKTGLQKKIPMASPSVKAFTWAVFPI